MTEILIIFVLILLNGVFAMAELAIASSRRLRLQEMSGQGSGGARVALELADNPSGFLSTVQVGITLISIFNGAFGEASLVERLAPQLAAFPAVAPYARTVALGVVIVGITFASIIFGELVPKSIAMQHPEQVAALVAQPLQMLSRIMSPVVRLLALVNDLIVRLLRLSKPRDDAPTQQEISGMLKEGTDAGVLDQTEYEILRRAMRLDAQRLTALMTPRIDLQFIDLDAGLQDNLARIAASPHSRFPVYSGQRSHIVGVVDAGDLLQQAVEGRSLQDIDIGAAARPALYVPASVTARVLLEQFREHGAELALAVDEHGQVQGMVTMADLMGALMGGVPGVEARERDAVQREDGSWLMDGAMPLERLRDLLGTAAQFPGEADGACQTLAGFMMHQLGRIPAPSEHVEWEGRRFEVVDMDRNRVDRVLVSTV